jgi:hypothetical protein
MSRVKCQLTGEYGTSATFYKAPNGKYYKSEEMYKAWEKEKDDRKYISEMIATDFLGYVEGQVFPTFIFKKLKELEFYGYDIIKTTIERCRTSIEYAMSNKVFKNDNARISYIFAIIRNNINDIYKEHVINEKTIENQEKHVTNFEVTDEYAIMNIGSKQKAKDISEFLED